MGKGLTFDSGGYNIKAGAGSMIEKMKFDMGGAATVAIIAVAILHYCHSGPSLSRQASRSDLLACMPSSWQVRGRCSARRVRWRSSLPRASRCTSSTCLLLSVTVCYCLWLSVTVCDCL